MTSKRDSRGRFAPKPNPGVTRALRHLVIHRSALGAANALELMLQTTERQARAVGWAGRLPRPWDDDVSDGLSRAAVTAGAR